jgi:hypothetical protein
MAFLQLQLRCTLAQQPAVEEVLEAMGALSVTLADAHADAPDEQAIFEPGVGEMPLWNEIVVQALFDADADPAVLREAVLTQVDALDADAVSFRARRGPGLGAGLDGPLRADAIRAATVGLSLVHRAAGAMRTASWSRSIQDWPLAPARIRRPHFVWNGWTTLLGAANSSASGYSTSVAAPAFWQLRH